MTATELMGSLEPVRGTRQLRLKRGDFSLLLVPYEEQCGTRYFFGPECSGPVWQILCLLRAPIVGKTYRNLVDAGADLLTAVELWQGYLRNQLEAWS